MPVHGLLGARVQDKRVVLPAVRRADRAFRWLDMRGKRIVAPLFHHGGIDLEFAGGSAESHRLVLVILDREFDAMRFLLQIVPGYAETLEAFVGEILERGEILLETELAAKRDDELPV